MVEISGSSQSSVKMTVFWDVLPYSMVEIDLRNAGRFLPDFVAQHIRRQSSSECTVIFWSESFKEKKKLVGRPKRRWEAG